MLRPWGPRTDARSGTTSWGRSTARNFGRFPGVELTTRANLTWPWKIPWGLFAGQVLIPLDAFQHVVRHFDGRMTLSELQSKIERETGRPVPFAVLETLVEKLDRAMVLEGPAYSAFTEQFSRLETRPSSHAGRSYPADGVALRAELARFFECARGSGTPSNPEPGQPRSLRAILSPHIDFGRGGPVYSHAYKSLFERSDAEVFIIIGVAHQYCQHRFALTRKDFQTPLGIARTDRAFVDHLAEVAGNQLFEDELAHRTEHSIRVSGRVSTVCARRASRVHDRAHPRWLVPRPDAARGQPDRRSRSSPDG